MATGRQIEDGEPARAQSNARARKVAGIVGTAMLHDVSHSNQERRIDGVGRVSVNDSANATHGDGPFSLCTQVINDVPRWA
jgi:hypothetical protein